MLYTYTATYPAVLVHVIALRDSSGVRASRDAIALMRPAIGNLMISDWHGENAMRRVVRIANLYHPTRGLQVATVLQPIFEPSLVRMNDRGFLLVGYEIHALSTQRTATTMQEWWVKPAAPASL